MSRILYIGAHPDDIELSSAGTIIQHSRNGVSVSILDLTKGEMGTRGTPELRLQEAEAARQIMGVSERYNAGLRDGYIDSDDDSIHTVIKYIRHLKPDIVVANAPHDRHPDHGAASKLADKACFMSGLQKLETSWEGENQESWRPRKVLNYIQDHYIKPDIVVDVSDVWDAKMEAVLAYKSQFYSEGDEGPATPISTPEFLEFLKSRASEFGRLIGVKYGEGYLSKNPVGFKRLENIF